jgi:hypothetical protein
VDWAGGGEVARDSLALGTARPGVVRMTAELAAAENDCLDERDGEWCGWTRAVIDRAAERGGSREEWQCEEEGLGYLDPALRYRVRPPGT